MNPTCPSSSLLDAAAAAHRLPWWRALLSEAATGDAGREVGSEETVALVNAGRRGDRGAMGQLYLEHVDATFAFMAWQLADRDQAHDLTQEVWLRVVRGIGSFRWQGRHFEAWVLTIARNVLRDHQRAAGRRPQLVELPDDAIDLPDPGLGPVGEAMRVADVALLADALAHLSVPHRQVLVLRFILELPVAEAARALGRSVGATKVLQLRALRALASHLPPEVMAS